MTHTVIPPHLFWQAALQTKYPAQEYVEPLEIDVFAREDCPPIRRITTGHISANVHPQHLILLGQRQLRAIPDYAMVCRRDFQAGPVLCTPATGTLLASESVRHLVLLHDELSLACCQPTTLNWKKVMTMADPLYTGNISIPAVWTVAMACGDANIGSVIECINHESQSRLYAELRSIVAADFYHALFTARVMGFDPGQYRAL